MKAILLHVADDPCFDARVQVALDLTRSLDAHVTFLQTVPSFYSVPIDAFGMAFTDIMPQMRSVARELRDALEEKLKREDVLWDWVTVEGPADARILSVVNTYDLLVLGACDPFDSSQHHTPLAADMAVNSHAPVLVVPQAQGGLDCTRPAVVAWDGSPEASRALRSAVPLLKRAEAVFLVSIEEERRGRTYDLPAISGAQHLSRHGIESEIVEVRKNDLDTAECIVTAARERSASYVVMGAYGRSRMRETLLGGVTRDMIADPEFPLLMHH